MEKINFINNSEPDISAENLNLMQTNIENAINGILESGTNDNGSWIKFNDGTMICRITLSKEKFLNSTSLSTTVQGINIYRSNVVNWNFPVSFVNTDIQINITTNTLSNGTRFAFGRVNSILTKSLVEIQLLGLEDFTENAVGYTNLNKVYVMAIGKWK